MRDRPVARWPWIGPLLAGLALLPFLFAGLTGTPEEGLAGWAGFQSAARSVYCTDGPTPFSYLVVAELALLAGLVAAAHLTARPGRPGWLAALREDGWLLVGLAVLVAMPFLLAWGTGTSACTRGRAFFWESKFIDLYVLTILAISYNLMFGFTGVVSFGHAAFFGLGTYTFGLMMDRLGATGGVALLAALTAVLVGVLIALVKGVVGLRIRGLYFALFTLAIAQVFLLLFSNRLFADYTGAEDGMGFSVPALVDATRNRLVVYYLVLACLVLAYWVVRRLMHSPTGRVLVALRDNEARAQMLGYNTFYFKLIAIVLAGIMASGAGVLRGLTLKSARPEVLSLDFTMTPLLMTLIGGSGTFMGPVVGAFGIYFAEEALRDRVVDIAGASINIGERWTLILGVLFVLSVIVFPYGIVGTLRARWLAWQARRQRPPAPTAPRLQEVPEK